MSGICTILWAIFASALFSSNSWKPLPSWCNPFLYAKGASEPARILVQIPLMEFQNLHNKYVSRVFHRASPLYVYGNGSVSLPHKGFKILRSAEHFVLGVRSQAGSGEAKRRMLQ